MFDVFGAPSCDGDTLLQLVGKFLTTRPHSPNKHESSLPFDYADDVQSPGARLSIEVSFCEQHCRRGRRLCARERPSPYEKSCVTRLVPSSTSKHSSFTPYPSGIIDGRIATTTSWSDYIAAPPGLLIYNKSLSGNIKRHYIVEARHKSAI